MEESSGSKEVELCPCHAGEPCIWVPKVMVGDDEAVPLGITKEDFPRFRLINCIRSQSASWGDIDGPAFYEFILCPDLRNLITTLKKQISPKPRTGTRCRWRCGSEPSEPLARMMLATFGSEPEQKSETPKFSVALVDQLKMSMKDKEKYRHFYCAEMALADYNNKHSTNYKLVEAINSVGFFDPSFWYHCAFRAAVDPSSAPVLFFAEINVPQSDQHIVHTTPILDDTETTLDGCICCLGGNIPHPVNNFYRGLNDGNFRGTCFNLHLRFDQVWCD